MDEATTEMRNHFRAVHPTKAFNENVYRRDLENWLTTADEWLERSKFGAHRRTVVQPPAEEIQWATIYDWCSYAYEFDLIMPPEIKEELMRQYNEWNAARVAANAAGAPVPAPAAGRAPRGMRLRMN